MASSDTRYTYNLDEIRAALGLTDRDPSTKALYDETFKKVRRVNDWRNYVHRKRWRDMTHLGRVIQYAWAYREVMNEEWD